MFKQIYGCTIGKAAVLNFILVFMCFTEKFEISIYAH